MKREYQRLVTLFVSGLDPLHDPRAGTAHPSLPKAGHEPVDRREEQLLSNKNYQHLSHFF